MGLVRGRGEQFFCLSKRLGHAGISSSKSKPLRILLVSTISFSPFHPVFHGRCDRWLSSHRGYPVIGPASSVIVSCEPSAVRILRLKGGREDLRCGDASHLQVPDRSVSLQTAASVLPPASPGVAWASARLSVASWTGPASDRTMEGPANHSRPKSAFPQTLTRQLAFPEFQVTPPVLETHSWGRQSWGEAERVETP